MCTEIAWEYPNCLKSETNFNFLDFIIPDLKKKLTFRCIYHFILIDFKSNFIFKYKRDTLISNCYAKDNFNCNFLVISFLHLNFAKDE